MKKVYTKPSLQILEVENQSILAGSLNYTDTLGDPSLPVYSKRRNSDFDDEDYGF
ncbi:MAG: hypothetical protein Q4F85_11905 [Prevotella sp.]|nr:hypothetical protein [Prevotella sp.]